MPFGLCNAQTTFQRLMDSILINIKGEEMLLYPDDIIIISSAIEQHVEKLSNILDRLKTANLFLQLLKCSFSVSEVEDLDHCNQSWCKA